MAEAETDDLNDGELAALDRKLRAGRRGLSTAALERIRATIQRELAARGEGTRTASQTSAPAIQAWPLFAAIAALVLLALTMAYYSFTQTPREIQSAKVLPGEPRELMEREPGFGIPRDELMRRRSELLLKFLQMDRSDEGARASVAAELLRITPDANIPETTTPGELRFLGALGFIASHLQWHADFAQAEPQQDVHQNLQDDSATTLDLRWTRAHAGEPWMFAALPPDQRHALSSHGEGLSAVEGTDVFWTLDDPSHADVKRAIALLGSVKVNKDTKDVGARAARWAHALHSNNTVLTMDVAGGYPAGKAASVMLDARAADHITFKLYRIRQAAELLAIARRIGTDFIFADHEQEMMNRAVQLRDTRASEKQFNVPAPPTFLETDLVQTWSVDLSKIKGTPAGWNNFDEAADEDQWDIDEDGGYFGDDCAEYAPRINKDYGQELRASSWLLGRRVSIPAEALKVAGAYALVAEGNGQCAVAPIIVDPLVLALRRCRDGVMALVSEPGGGTPIAGANLLADGLLNESVTDASGVSFARVFAAGDRSIIAWRDGRASIGGFGRLFDGVYGMSSSRFGCAVTFRDAVQGVSHPDQSFAHVYEDRRVVAAYTDRPVYRPGQDVSFKLILRLLGDSKPGAATVAGGFRDDDFEKSKLLTLPNPNDAIAYEVLDSKNRAVAAGTASVNDFGTAIGAIHLNEEASGGAYALRLNLGGATYIVPAIFNVKSYRRPNFEVKLGGVPVSLTMGSKMDLSVSARYYFGQPVTASAHLRLISADGWQTFAETVFKINTGSGAASVPIPAEMDAGKYFVLCSVSDDSGQTVTQSEPTAVVALAPALRTLSALPTFMALSSEIKIAAPINHSLVKAEQTNGDARTAVDFAPVNGIVTIKFAKGGWWTVQCRNEYASVFVYGDAETPFSSQRVRESTDRDWVNLAVYGGETDSQMINEMRCTSNVWALFDRQRADVGSTLKLLVYIPNASPRILFTFEGRTVIDYAVISPAGNGPYYVVELPIRARHVPNFYLQACLISHTGDAELEKLARELRDAEALRPEGDDPRWCRVDVVDPHATPGSERLKVSLATDRANYHPGENVDVSIQVTAPDGAPRSAEVSLSAVDESVFAFGDDNVSKLAVTFADARPARLFLPKAWRINRDPKRRLLECACDQMSRNHLDEATKAHLGVLQPSAVISSPISPLHTLGQMPASQILLPNWREDFRETAAWLPQIRTSADGRATAKFKLPDSLTRFRLTAVGLTRQTEIGTGKSALTASLPLSVQVFAPRFAIEGDRLQLAGIIRNDSDAAITAPYAWEIQNATPQTDVLGSALAGTVTLEAHAAITVHMLLAFNTLGQASVGLKAGDAAIADGERRAIPVFPDGRPMEVALNGNARADDGTIKFPAGFLPSDLTLTLTRSDPSQPLNDGGGLGYLIEYPYGCVEQTMSRFLPAVVVKHAAQQNAAALPDEIGKRLPNVINAGLARLYKFQHEDGGWGWWEKDQTNQRMSVYVLYGLARCKACGVAVDASVLEKACAFLKVELKFGRLDPELIAWAWDALALAGAADADGLKVQVRTLQPFNERARGYLALACELAGLKSDAQFIWNTIKGWQPANAEDLALKLNLDVAFGELPDARETAVRLSALRRGLRWSSTWDTARAIEALTALAPKLPPLAPARSMRVSINGNLAFEAKTPEALLQRTFGIHLSSTELFSTLLSADAKKETVLKIEADCVEPVQYALNSTGYQKLSDSAGTGTEVRMTRQYFSSGGKPLAGPIKIGDIVEVQVKVALLHPQSYLLVEDRRPAGCEFSADIIQGADAKFAANVEFRDDRICVFFDGLNAGEHVFTYYLRAENPGTSHVIPGCAYPMYNEKMRGESAPAVLEVLEKQ